MVRESLRKVPPTGDTPRIGIFASRPFKHSAPMRILAVSDLHYNLKQFDWLSSVAGEYDLVVIAGDLLDLAGHTDLDSVAVLDDLFTVCPWRDGPASREAMRAFIDAERGKPHTRWFWLHHAAREERESLSQPQS